MAFYEHFLFCVVTYVVTTELDHFLFDYSINLKDNW